MKEFKGSPAPWRINAVDYHDYGLIDAEGEEIMLLKAECEQDDHNASLIAASPDLLKALQEMLNKAYKQNWNDQYPDEVSKAQAAISKALGEE